MPAERAGYTVTMFCIDVSPSMGKLRTVEASDGDSNGFEITNLAWAMQYVLLKIQEMIFHGRKTDLCGVILFGTEETNNSINDSNGGYDHVYEYIPIGQPNSGTLAKLQALQPSTEIGDPIDAIIVAIETQDKHLGKKKSWTRKLVLLTDGENPIEIEDWELTVNKINSLSISTMIIGIDFDDEEFGFKEEDKSVIKHENEKFFRRFTAALNDDLGIIGTAERALIECRRPDVKETKSPLAGTILRIGDVDVRPEEAIELPVKMSKCTAVVRPPSMKKFAKRTQATSGEEPTTQESQPGGDDEDRKDVYAQLVMHTEYLVKAKEDEDDAEKDEDEGVIEDTTAEKVDKDQLIRGFKYGASYAPCPDGQFPRLSTRKGIDIVGFFPDNLLRRELAMGEVQYVWADPSSGEVQVAFSSIVQAMVTRNVVAIGRLVSRDEMDPKMGLLIPRQFEKVDCFLWMQMPFADDVRRYTFPSLENLVSKKGEKITTHPFLPTDDQMEAMENFVDSMDLMEAGERNESGGRDPWFDPRFSYNPAIHRIKQALFHAAIVTDLRTNPLPPPHDEVVKYLNPPRRVIKRVQPVLEECKQAFNVKQVPKRVIRTRKNGHVRAEDDDDEFLILDSLKPATSKTASQAQTQAKAGGDANVSVKVKKRVEKIDDDSETEPDSDDEGAVSRTRELAARRTVQLPSPEPSVINGQDAQSQSQSQYPVDSQSQSYNLSQGQPEIGKEPNHIIGAARPLEDFKTGIEDEEKVQQAISEIMDIVRQVLSKPFAVRRHEEMIECLREVRVTCLKKGHIESWNSFLEPLKESCLSPTKINNKSFWDELRESGTEISLIGESEAKQFGGSSEVSDGEAKKFLQA